MKIEFWYDPVYTETHIRINGNWQDESDIYGFLYPVRGYPLQTWLQAAGSWTGIVRQLMDLSRGEKIELEFYGRNVDYQDFSAAVSGMEGVRLNCLEWNAPALYSDKIRALEKNIRELEERIPMDSTVAGRLSDAGKASPDDDSWLISVVSREDLQYAERDNRLCCMVDSCVLDSLEMLADIERLSRSMRRPMDAICCRFSDNAEKEAFAAYASQFPRMQFLFVMGDEEGWREKLWVKYGEASWIKRRLQEGTRLCEEVLGRLDTLQSINDKKRMELVHTRMEHGLDRNGEQELTDCSEMATNIHAYQKIWRNLKTCMAERLPENARNS